MHRLFTCIVTLLTCIHMFSPFLCFSYLGSSGNLVTTFLGNPKKSHFYWASGIISWSKKRPKSQKQLCTYGIIFPKSGIIPCTRKNFAILVVLSVRNNIPYAHLSVRNIPKKSVRNILPYAQHRPHVYSASWYICIFLNARNRRSVELDKKNGNSFIRTIEKQWFKPFKRKIY